MSDNYQYDVFISYARPDREWVKDPLQKRLEGAKLRVCVDYRDFEAGELILANIENLVKASRRTLMILSPAYLERVWTQFECVLLQTQDPVNQKRRFIPVLKDRCTLPDRLSIFTYLNFANPEDEVLEWRKLFTALECPLPDKDPSESTASPATSGRLSRKIDQDPFITGSPIFHPRNFFGRTYELTRLFALVKGSQLQNGAIIGPRRSGKTSLLNYMRRILYTPAEELRPGQKRDWVPHPERYIWIYVDFQDPTLRRQVGLLGYLLQEMQMERPDPLTLETFIRQVRDQLRSRVVILMDEMGAALGSDSELDDPFWEGIRSLATTQTEGRMGFILATDQHPTEMARQVGRSSPFFNTFGYSARLGPFKEVEARELMAQSPIPFAAEDQVWILETSQGWPLLVQILCRECLFGLENGLSEWREEGLVQLDPFKGLLR